MSRFSTIASSVYFKILKLLGGLLIIYQINRLIFFLFNRSYLEVETAAQYLKIALYGIRFDLSAIFTINFPFLFFLLLPFTFTSQGLYQRALKFWFLCTNVLACIFDIADIAYFPYVRKRMTADVFSLIGNKSDFLDLLPSYLSKFWYISLLIVLFFAVLYKLYHKIMRDFVIQKFSIKNLVVFLSAMGISIIAVRGGWQLRPLVLSNTLMKDNRENSVLVGNTPFSILKTLGNKPLQEFHFFEPNEITKFLNPVKNYQKNKPFRNSNVVVIVLESFGKGYTGIGGRKSYTPFLDSLMNAGMNCTYAFANAFRSSDGIPAIFSGVPYIMDEAFSLSPYATNKMDALPSLLKQKGYQTSFFHGGTNGTMGFDTYCRNAGFDSYYGRKEYNNDADYDGTWGIWDEPFLQFFAEKLSKQNQPFLSTVFTLSSHEPFQILGQYKNTEIGKLRGIQRGISYTDMALQKFFKTASQTDWYHNTLFVITADHNYLAAYDSLGYYSQGMGLFAIPALLFHPGDPGLYGSNHHLFQQIDIMPTILDYLHFDKSFFSFGKSIFDTTAMNYCYTNINNEHFMLQPPYLFTAVYDKIYGIYRFDRDSTFRQNLINQIADSSIQPYKQRYLAFLQLLHYCIINNKQSVSSYP